MRRAMAEAEVGDDDYGEDPTVRALEEAFAARVGKPAALFAPSGVMANQIAVRVLSRPGTAVVAGRRQHVVAYEYGAAALNAGIQFIELDDADGMLSGGRGALGAPGRGAPPAGGVAGGDREHAHGGVGGDVDAGRARRARRGGRRRPDPHGRGAVCSTPKPRPACRPRRWAAGRDDGDVLPVQGPLRAGRLAAGRDRTTSSPRAGWPASGWAAACARPVCSPPRAWSRCARWSSGSPRTTCGRPGWPTRWRSAGRARSTRTACARTS